MEGEEKKVKTKKELGLTRVTKKPRKTLQDIHDDGKLVLIYDRWCQNGNKPVEAVRTVLERPDMSITEARNFWNNRVETSETVRRIAMNRVNKRKSRAYMNIEERKAFLTEVILGEREADAETKDRLKAIQILNNMEGIGTPTFMAQQNTLNLTQNSVSVTVEDKRNFINQRLNEILGIPAEGKEEQKKEGKKDKWKKKKEKN